jgi:hypothetical protein
MKTTASCLVAHEREGEGEISHESACGGVNYERDRGTHSALHMPLNVTVAETK